MAQDTPSLDKPSNPEHAKPPSGLRLVTLAPPPPSRGDSRGKALPANPYLGATVDGRYKLEDVLGEGGMGVVYLCRHTIIDKKVAMKVLRADKARDEEITERFLNEARAASTIGNPHIIDISDFGRFPDGSTYFVMEYLDGVPLSKIVKPDKPVPVPRLLHIARQLAEGLAAAHSQGIIHRDLKPDNIILISRGAEEDFVKILDFGIAKVSTHNTNRLTRAGAVFGTPHYMAPEQAAGAPVDHRGDIYSLGIILYELASGKVPFDADNFMGILTQHMYKAPVPIRALVPEPQAIPPGLEAIILKCLSKRAEQRYQTMAELKTDLEKASAGLVPDAVPDMMNRSGGFHVPTDYFNTAVMMPAAVPASPVRQRGVWPVYAGVAGVAAAIGLVVTIFTLGKESTASQVREQAHVPVVAPQPRGPTPPESPSAGRETGVDAPPSAPSAAKVVIATDPLEAQVFRDGVSLGQSPVIVEVLTGTPTQLSIEADGYETQVIDVDASQTKRTVKLARRPTPRFYPKPKPSPRSGGGEIVDPWQ